MDRLISAAVSILLGFLVWLYARSRDQEMLDNVPVPVHIILSTSQADQYDLEVTGPSQVTASFAGAPALSFTTFGASAPRDGAVIGLGAKTTVAERTSVYLRYDGDFAGGNTNHVLNAGVRYIW